MFKINTLNFFIFHLGLFSFLFLWDIKIDNLQLRYLIILSTFFLISNIRNYNTKKFLITIFFPSLILVHFLVLSTLFNYTLEFRDLFGLIFLYIIFFVVINSFEYLENSFETIINAFIILFSISFLLYFWYSNSLFNLDCYDGWFFNNKFVFVENSHFSIISVPIINYYIFKFSENYNYKKIDYIKIFFFIIFFIISILNFSTTFLVGLILTQFYILIKNLDNKKIIISAIILISLSTFILLNYKQCVERSIGSINPAIRLLMLKGNNEGKSIEEKKKFMKKENFQINMSVETLLTSFEITYNSLKNDPFGVGFNKYHLAHQNYIDQILKADNQVKKNNVYDGSTNLTKISTEFGLFGIFIILFFLYSLIIKKKYRDFDVFIISLICMQFIRGVGYFNGGFILVLIIYFYKLFKDKQQFRKHKS
ncbi:hypothetical protein [Candidatus Pelagibacter sp.]|uniref:hypothetical protein n=1 Tax=Candidatus Pelagibacter sp. TaxID=2024849 RepID=UPI003F839B81